MQIKKILPLLIISLSIQYGYSQGNKSHITDDNRLDSLIKKGIVRNSEKYQEILLSLDEATRFLKKTAVTQAWKDKYDPLRSSIERLLFEAENPPFDSTGSFLKFYPYDSISIQWDKFFIWEPRQLRIRKDTTKNKLPENHILLANSAEKAASDSISAVPETGGSFAPKDTTVMVIADTLSIVSTPEKRIPFRYYRYPYQSDSIKAAIGVLLDYLQARDSTLLTFSGSGGKSYKYWLNSGSENVMRYWLKNDLDDSVTVWIANPEHNRIGLFLENGVSFRRPSRQRYISEASVNVKPQDKSKLINGGRIITRQQFWNTHTEASVILNQAWLSNWVKGGESSISTTIDVTWFANYTNKPRLISSNNFARIKYGLVASVSDGIRKNLDLFETSSKINHKAFGKFDFSAVMLFKTQVSKGYNYPDVSVPVSKFFNPAILTLGVGLDYKPDKNTSINFSPFSYKGTFVPDTATIDQTKYGVAANKKSMNEPGISLLVSNDFRPFRNVSVTNRFQLFSNYINNPLNVDVDWEMILKASLNWFTEVRLNTHLIYDEDTKTPVFDKDNNPVLGSDGLQQKSARVQFKELIGLSFIFRF